MPQPGRLIGGVFTNFIYPKKPAEPEPLPLPDEPTPMPEVPTVPPPAAESPPSMTPSVVPEATKKRK